MQRPNSGKKNLKQQKLTLLDLEHIKFQVDGAVFDAESAPDEVFEAFIRQYVNIGYSLEKRCEMLNFAISQGVAFLMPAEG
jgi:hypothetical protein